MCIQGIPNRVLFLLLCLLIFLFLYGCKSDKTQILRIKGSDTEVNVTVLLAEAFSERHPDLRISVSGGGSGLGIASLMNGLTDIANSSREINPYESTMLQARKVEVVPVIFAQDALAIIVNKQNELDEISVNELQQIFSGHISNWQALTGLDKRIHIYGRQGNSGTHEYFKKRLGIEFTLHAREMNGNAQIIEAVKSDLTGIGYVGVGYIMKNGRQIIDGIKVLKVADSKGMAVSPLDLKAVSEGLYFFQRPLYEYVRKQSFPHAKPFLDFVRSSEGQSIILANGYFPTAATHEAHQYQD